MTTSRFAPPLDYLQAASRASLQSYELTRLNHCANLRQEIAALLDQWVQENSEALLARWMLDHHKSLQPAPMTPTELVRTLVDVAPLPLPESPAPPELSPAAPPLAPPRPAFKTSLTRKPPRQRLPSVS